MIRIRGRAGSQLPRGLGRLIHHTGIIQPGRHLANRTLLTLRRQGIGTSGWPPSRRALARSGRALAPPFCSRDAARSLMPAGRQSAEADKFFGAGTCPGQRPLLRFRSP
ncbi:hypothetical protein HMPREF9946_04299 [Acetobacteraceae bacterium AT-5844]|nr:hypothetical protein HMPREF9946_04299 [Acetobacteraceae bacterium AT-5844]